MPPQPYPYLALTNGTTTIVLADGAGGLTSYPLVRGAWAPAVAERTTLDLAGIGRYDDTLDELLVNVLGATPEAAMANLETLAELLEGAIGWMRSESSTPVRLRYAPQGSNRFSTAAPAEVVLVERAGDTRIDIELPQRFADVGMLSQVDGVRLVLPHRAPWLEQAPTFLSSTEQYVPPAAGGANPSVQTLTFTGTPATVPSPLAVSTFSTSPSVTKISPHALVLGAPSTPQLQIFEAESLLPATKYTSQADAANIPRGGAVLRYTPTDLLASPTAILAPLTGRPAWHIYAAVRNNSATTSFFVKARAYGPNSTALILDETPFTLIDTSSQTPRVVRIGTLRTPDVTTLVRFDLVCQATAASGSLDIDYLVLLDALDPQCWAVSIQGLPNPQGPLAIRHPHMFNTRYAQVTSQAADGVFPQPGGTFFDDPVTPGGDPAITTRGNTLAVTVLQCGDTAWRVLNAANTAADTQNASAARRRAFKVPL